MADSNIQIEVTGDKELIRHLNNYIEGGLNVERGLGASGLYLTRFFSGEVFASRGRVIGKPWPRLNDRYAAWKARKFPGRPPLVRSGEMLRGFKYDAERDSLELYNTADHFNIHQEGRGHVPERVMMRVDEQRAARVSKYILGDLTQQMRKERLI